MTMRCMDELFTNHNHDNSSIHYFVIFIDNATVPYAAGPVTCVCLVCTQAVYCEGR